MARQSTSSIFITLLLWFSGLMEVQTDFFFLEPIHMEISAKLPLYSSRFLAVAFTCESSNLMQKLACECNPHSRKLQVSSSPVFPDGLWLGFGQDVGHLNQVVTGLLYQMWIWIHNHRQHMVLSSLICSSAGNGSRNIFMQFQGSWPSLAICPCYQQMLNNTCL